MNKDIKIKLERKAIWKRNENRDRRCLIRECKKNAIKSHILQKNGIISLICEERHFYVLGRADFFNMSDTRFQYKRVGINEGLTFPLFCNIHDTELFSEIELGTYNPNSYRSQLLFSYRSICKELIKKEIQIDMQKNILNSSIMRQSMSDFYIAVTEELVQAYTSGAKDLRFYKNEIESELDKIKSSKLIESKFKFITKVTERLDICTSSVFSPLDAKTDVYQEAPLNSIMVSIFPKKDRTIIICGYHNNHFDKWMRDYTNSWDTLTQNQLEERISEILIKRCETWGMSPSLYAKISKDKKQRILEEFENDVANLDKNMKTSINIFDN